MGQRLLERSQGRGLAQVWKKTQDQPAADAEAIAADLERPMNPADHGVKGDAALGMRLRVEEDLGMAHVLRGGAPQVGPGQVIEILLLEQHGTAGVIYIQKRLQIAEHVGTANVVNGPVRQAD